MSVTVVEPALAVRSLTRADDAVYDAFLQGYPDALFYHSRRYRDFLQALLQCEIDFYGAFCGSRLMGVLPVMRACGPYGEVLNSLPFYGSHGGILAADQQARSVLQQRWRELVSAEEVIAATLVENPFAKTPSGLEGDLCDERIAQYTLLTEEDADPEHLLMRLDSTARRNVRKAERSEISVEEDSTALDFLYRQHVENMEAIGGKPKSRRFFELIPEHFSFGEHCRIYKASVEERSVAALLLFYYDSYVEYFVPVVESEARTLQPMAAILARALSDAAQKGYRVWNWGGTWLSQSGVYRFKRKWAATEGRYRYAIWVDPKRLRVASRQELADAYGGFYIAPYSYLDTLHTPGGSS